MCCERASVFVSLFDSFLKGADDQIESAGKGDLMRPQERSKDAPADGTAAVIPEFIDPDEAVVSGW